MTLLNAQDVTLQYTNDPVVHDLSLAIQPGKITTIIGPNGCGKSTLLRALARLMAPKSGTVVLDGQLIHQLPTREVAKRVGLLHQQQAPPGGITVEDLVHRGRYPHQSFFQPPSERDHNAVERALNLTGMQDLRRRSVDELSGGQRQRAWIAMAIAQETELLLFDEPTTFLDVAFQLEIMDLVRQLNAEEERTIVMVLHDINEASQISDHIVAMHAGRIVHEGTPEDVLQPQILGQVYGIACDVFAHTGRRCPFCVPRGAFCAAESRPPVDDVELGLNVENLQAGYDKRNVLNVPGLEIPAGKVTAIVGPNACGKSTLLRTCARLLRPSSGRVELGGKDVRHGSHRNFARRVARLAQGEMPPEGYLVEDIVAAGRMPHQGLLRQWSEEDEEAVESALRRCNLLEFRYREIATLSGGQRQRVWVAMALAQDTPTMLLDEPTTYLDLSAQVELLDLIRTLNEQEHRTIVMVLHDLNLAARYADHLIVMRDGRILATGAPMDVLTHEILGAAFEIDAQVSVDPATGAPLIVPYRSRNSQTDVVSTISPVSSGSTDADLAAYAP